MLGIVSQIIDLLLCVPGKAHSVRWNVLPSQLDVVFGTVKGSDTYEQHPIESFPELRDQVIAFSDPKHFVDLFKIQNATS